MLLEFSIIGFIYLLVLFHFCVDTIITEGWKALSEHVGKKKRKSSVEGLTELKIIMIIIIYIPYSGLTWREKKIGEIVKIDWLAS